MSCRYCLGVCDPVTHESSKRVMRWLLSPTPTVPIPRPVSPRRPQLYTAGGGLGDISALQSPATKKKLAAKMGSKLKK
jgi:hypothetical protein